MPKRGSGSYNTLPYGGYSEGTFVLMMLAYFLMFAGIVVGIVLSSIALAKWSNNSYVDPDTYDLQTNVTQDGVDLGGPINIRCERTGNQIVLWIDAFNASANATATDASLIKTETALPNACRPKYVDDSNDFTSSPSVITSFTSNDTVILGTVYVDADGLVVFFSDLYDTSIEFAGDVMSNMVILSYLRNPKEP
jgi:hypothetical protein